MWEESGRGDNELTSCFVEESELSLSVGELIKPWVGPLHQGQGRRKLLHPTKPSEKRYLWLERPEMVKWKSYRWLPTSPAKSLFPEKITGMWARTLAPITGQ